MRLIILSGLSGAGKTVALNMLEDLGYFCSDNIPAGILKAFVDETTAMRDPAFDQMAIGLDARSRADHLLALPDLVQGFRESGIKCETVYLFADDEALIKRYSETRRRHPLSGGKTTLREAIENERSLLATIAESADLAVDTTSLNIHELRDLVRRRIARREQSDMSLLLESFGYKNGVPEDADFVFDARCLPNPYWEPSLRAFDGRDKRIADYLADDAMVARFLDDIHRFLERWVPAFEQSNRSYLTVAIGCTGGQHRSVYVAERLADVLSGPRRDVVVRHKELH